MLMDGPHKKLASKVNKILPQQKKRLLASNIQHRNVDPLFFIAILSIACMPCTHAKPLQGPLNDIDTAIYVPVSAIEMLGNAYQEYDGAKSGVDYANGAVDDTPVKASKRDVSTDIRYY